jgi:hypothetical protein
MKDFSFIGDVAKQLLGAPNEKMSTKDELRFGTQGSVCVDLKKHVWADYENDEHGGCLDLIKREMGFTDYRDCWAWLEQEGYVEKKKGNGKANGGWDGYRPTKYYDYVDETGAVLFQVVRSEHPTEPKRFHQRRSDGNGGWIEGKDCMRGVRCVPYKLPELIEGIADEQIIYVPEGEKDVETLQRLGLVATCNAGGAKKFKAALAQDFFEDADVVAIADNDDAGRKHVARMAQRLLGVVSRVRILDLAAWWKECPKKGDISDWVKAGGTVDELRGIVDKLGDYEETQEAATTGSALPNHPTLQFWYDDTEPRNWYLQVNGGEKYPIDTPEMNGPNKLKTWLMGYGHDTAFVPETCKEYFPWADVLRRNAKKNETTLAILDTDADEKQILAEFFDWHIQIDLRSKGKEFLDGKVGDFVRLKDGRIYFKWQSICWHFRRWNVHGWEQKRIKAFIARKGGQEMSLDVGWYSRAYWVPLNVFNELLQKRWSGEEEA